MLEKQGNLNPAPPNGEALTLKDKVIGLWGRLEFTFFNIHLAAFSFIPLIVSGIFYASNGRFPVPYLDALFLCYSAMTVTGLTTVNLSTLTVWQQVILYLLMTMVSSSFPHPIHSRLSELVGEHHHRLMDHGTCAKVRTPRRESVSQLT